MFFNDEYENQLLDKIKKTDWQQYKGPKDYSYRKVYPAFEDMVLLREEKNKWKVNSNFKYALGNDHGGTYYPAVLSALPLLIDLVIHSPHEPVRNCALEVLCDWSSSAEPELGKYTGIGAEALQQFVSHSIRNFTEQPARNDSERNAALLADIREYLLK
jgi:hypothetical protein